MYVERWKELEGLKMREKAIRIREMYERVTGDKQRPMIELEKHSLQFAKGRGNKVLEEDGHRSTDIDDDSIDYCMHAIVPGDWDHVTSLHAYTEKSKLMGPHIIADDALNP
ncbi:hypothetical protein POM88_051354 [Heracleum sosnowskyi]|uniref:Uncharacterized protein n=1 Tax=Heracleum sosnowskyi TaxID=360622 RepID=A0AAD8M3M6_9APIA|nr:hypothetical protein POM88_051354 [Heracleum sosnowskyi]